MTGQRQDYDPQVDMVAIAKLSAEGKKQTEIANLLGLSPSTVFRLLAKARQEVLREELHFLREKIPDDQMQKVFQRINQATLGGLLRKLAERHGQPAPWLRIFSCSSKDRPSRTQELSHHAAAYVRELLLRSARCGITWGAMLRSVVSAVQGLQVPSPWRKEMIECVPLSGEPLMTDMPKSFSSSNLAHDLGITINGDQYSAKVESLAMVPAFIPSTAFSASEISGVRKLIDLVKSHEHIFGSGPKKPTTQPLAERLDMILSSVGPAERPFGFGILFGAGSVSSKQLEELIIGEAGGVCFEKPNLSTASRKKLEAVKARWTGLRIEHLRSCSKYSTEHSRAPGVVIISHGKDKAKIICELLKQGLVNHLIIDNELAQELEKITKGIA